MNRLALASLLLVATATTPSLQAQAEAIQRTEIFAEHFESVSTETETRFLFATNVVVTGNNIRLTCDRMEIIAVGLGDKSKVTNKLDKFKYLLATGKVHIVQGDREAHCGRAEILPREDHIILTENPVIIDRGDSRDHPTIATGTKLVLKRGKRQVEGDNVKVVLAPLKDLGFDKNQPLDPAPKAESTK